ncbi:MAG: GntR family transcriptional regulator [bacterium]|nr:GntR family transcriptional regulator [bacterium]
MNKGINLLFQVQPSSGVPIYRQIIDQVERLIISGALQPGDELPSVRQAAAELEINQMTISKAYSLMEAKGLLERSRGKPMAVASRRGKGRSLEQRMELIRPVLTEAATQARQLALPKDTVLNEFTRLLEEENE